MPKVSVIIPVYNVEQYLRQCLESTINQTLRDIEIICVNDCSPDNSLSILQEYAAKDSRVKVINLEENKGPGIARNTALDAAQGDYIMFLDPDDWYEPDACETAYNQISNNKNDMVIFGYNKFVDNTQKSYLKLDTVSPYIPFCNQKSINFSDIDINWLKNAHTWFYIYDKKLLDNNNVRYGEFYLCEDVPFIIKATYFAKDISVIVKPLYNYRVRTTATNQSSKNYLWHDLINARKFALDFINSTENKERTLPHILYLVQSLSYWFIVFRTRVDYKIQKQFYNEMQQIFKQIEKNYNLLDNTDAQINKKRYKRILNKSFGKYVFDSFVRDIITIKNQQIDGKPHKILSVFKGKFIVGFQK